MHAQLVHPSKRRRVLLAHQDHEAAEHIKRALGDAGFPNVTVAGNARIAIEKIRRGCFYILITVTQLPDIGSAQFMRILRSGRFLFTPPVIVTVGSDPDLAVPTQPAAYDALLVSVATIDQLPHAVERALAQINPLQVLIVEDDEPAAETARACLEPWFAVDVTGSAEAGLAAYSPGKYALILLDLMLPDAPGVTVLHEIKSLDSMQRVIVVSANPSPETDLPFPLGETLGLVRKPYNIDLLRAACCLSVTGTPLNLNYTPLVEDVTAWGGLADDAWEALLRDIP